jgi:mono/diheme cytochrome c family protein
MMRLLLFATIACALWAQSAGKPAGNVQNGKKFFESYGCYQCHGHEGQGGAGARLAPRPIPYERFSKYVRQPADQMPPYTAKVVPDRELADIYAFLESIPAAPPAKSIPLLNN